MTTEPDPDLMLLYVSGVADADEAARAERLLSSAHPDAQAAYAEAVALFNAVPLGLDSVPPPATVGEALMRRVTADLASATPSPFAASSTVSPSVAPSTPTMSFGSTTVAAGAAANGRPAAVPPGDYASRFRWPLYLTSGLAACLAVALTLSVWNNSRLSDHNSRMLATLSGSQDVLRSPHLTLASMQTGDGTAKSFGRVLFCPVTRQYQVTVFNLKPLPAGKAYELWLITPDGRKVPAGLFAVDGQGTATVIAHPQQPVDVAANAAVTDEPATGSDAPTGSIHLVGALPAR